MKFIWGEEGNRTPAGETQIPVMYLPGLLYRLETSPILFNIGGMSTPVGELVGTSYGNFTLNLRCSKWEIFTGNVDFWL